MKYLHVLLFILSTCIAGAADCVWTGAAGDGDFNNAANWLDYVTPDDQALNSIKFAGQGSDTAIIYLGNADVHLENLDFTGSAQRYILRAGAGSIDIAGSISLGNGSVMIENADVRFRGQTNINVPGEAFIIAGNVTSDSVGSSIINKTGAGTFRLSGPNDQLNSSIYIYEGALKLDHDLSAGHGAIYFNGGGMATTNELTLANDIYFRSGISGGTSILANHNLTLAGTITLDQLSTSLSLSGPGVLTVTGSIKNSTLYPSYSSKLSITGGATVILSGDNTYKGGTQIIGSKVYFMSSTAVPPSGKITSDIGSYVAVGFSQGVSSFINTLHTTEFRGVLGFETAVGSPTLTITETLNVSGVTNLKGIATNSTARIDGAIIVSPDAPYLFGGGTGTLYVGGRLAARGTNKVDVTSPFGAPLTVYLENDSATAPNSFTGNLNVQYSNVILNGAGALPAGVTIDLPTAGYVGITEKLPIAFSDFLARINAISDFNTIVGIDSATNQFRTVSDAINLSNRPYTGESAFYLGTSSKVILTGAITPTRSRSGDYNSLYLAAINDGYLNVASSLGQDTNITDVIIGQANSYLPRQGTVELSGYNSYAGSTTVLGGTLRINGYNNVGSGNVYVYDKATLQLGSSAYISSTTYLFAGSTLTGTGEFNAQVFAMAGSHISPGGSGSIGILHFHNGLTIDAGTIITIDLSHAGVDQLCVWNEFKFNGDALTPIVINVQSATGNGQEGAYVGFDPTMSYTWMFAYNNTAVDITGFDPSIFLVDGSRFNLLNNSNGIFSIVALDSRRLALTFTPVPEPSTYALMGLGAVVLAFFEYRRRNRRG